MAVTPDVIASLLQQIAARNPVVTPHPDFPVDPQILPELQVNPGGPVQGLQPTPLAGPAPSPRLQDAWNPAARAYALAALHHLQSRGLIASGTIHGDPTQLWRTLSAAFFQHQALPAGYAGPQVNFGPGLAAREFPQ